MNVQDTLNLMINALLPVLNKELPAFIASEGLDPLENVDSSKDTLGKINLGICKAKAKANYDIKDMKGLSSMEVKSATITSIGSTNNLSNISGTISLSVKLNSNLSAKVSGKLKASCSGISESVKISGKVTAKGVTGNGDATFEAALSDNKGASCFSTIDINKLNFKYNDIDVKIDGLGIFNEFLKPLVDVVDDLFGEYITDELTPVIRNELNKELTKILPVCI